MRDMVAESGDLRARIRCEDGGSLIIGKYAVNFKN
jgi:hypothetical protein